MWHPRARFPAGLSGQTKEDKVIYFDKGFTLHHKMIDVVHQSLLLDFVESSEHLIALVTGPTGVGKSCLSQIFLSDLYEGYEGFSEGYVVAELPAIYIEAPVHSSATFAWKDFYERVLEALYEMENIKVYGKPRVEEIGEGRTYSTRNRTEQELRKDVERRLQDLNTNYILIDEIQHIFKYGGKTGEKNLDILKSLSNITGCRIVGFGTYESSFTIERSAQLARRTKNIEFPPYDLSDEESTKDFASAYMGMLAHVPMQLDKSLGAEADAMFIGSCGCVGILKQWCQRAMTRALNMNDEVLGFEHFKHTRLRASELRLIAEEIKEGRAFFSEPEDDELIELLGGNKPIVMQKEKKDKKKSSLKPGKRKLGRDLVG